MMNTTKDMYRLTFNLSTDDREIAQSALSTVASIAEEVTGSAVDRLFTRMLGPSVFTAVLVFDAETEEADAVVHAVKRLPGVPPIDAVALKRKGGRR